MRPFLFTHSITGLAASGEICRNCGLRKFSPRFQRNGWDGQSRSLHRYRLRDFTGKVGSRSGGIASCRWNYGIGLHLGLCVLKEQAHDGAQSLSVNRSYTGRSASYGGFLRLGGPLLRHSSEMRPAHVARRRCLSWRCNARARLRMCHAVER